MEEYTITRGSPMPLHYQLSQLLLSKIRDGSYPVGTYIPSEVELMKEYQVSRTTVRHAIMDLVNKGYITRERAKGTIVNPPRQKEHFVQMLTSVFDDDVRSRGMEPSTEIMDFRLLKAAEIACVGELSDVEEFNTANELYFLKRIRYTNNQPYLILNDFFPGNCKTLSQITPEDIIKNGVTKSLSPEKEPMMEIVRVVRKFWAEISTEKEAEILQLNGQVALQCVKTYSYNANQELVRFTIAKFRGDRSELVIELSEK